MVDGDAVGIEVEPVGGAAAPCREQQHFAGNGAVDAARFRDKLT